jgi:photosystem II stability/assembly factor-like uncharacterized protein
VQDHVHAATEGSSVSQIYVATHYGLVRSMNGGRTWVPDGGLGQEMVGGLVKTGPSYVASLQPSGPGMKMSPAQSSSMPGMSMGTASTPNIGYSSDGVHWHSAVGIPAGLTVAALTTGPTSSTVWTSLLGHGVYESTDSGQDWMEVIPSTAPITDLAVKGQNLLLTTSSGLFVTSTASPTMPALPQLGVGVNDLAPFMYCTTCVVAALSSGGVALSHDDGVTWMTQASAHVFDEVASVPSYPLVLFGMVPAPGDAGHGLWRSSDGGHTWRRVLPQSLIDHLYEVPEAAGHAAYLLAFEWGITVFRSDDGGLTWARMSRISHQ